MINNAYKLLIVILMSITMANISFAMDVAITVDDLPSNGDIPASGDKAQIAKKMMSIFKKHHLTGIYGLINEMI